MGRPSMWSIPITLYMPTRHGVTCLRQACESNFQQVIGYRNVAIPIRRLAPPFLETIARARPRLRGGDWGWLPALSLLGACGVLLVALAHSSARYDTPWAQPLYWLGLV